MSKGDKNDKALARKIKSHVESCHKHAFAVSIIDGNAHTHHAEEPLASEGNEVEEEEEEDHDADHQPEVHGGETVDDMDDMDPDHDHLHVVAGECDLCDYFKLRDKTVAERREILIANDFM